MTAEEIDLVQNTWNAVKPIANTAADLFYEKLFELDPQVRSLFPDDMANQKKMLMQMISVAVASLRNPEKLIPAVQELGKRHVGYGVKDEDYQTVGTALLWTLEQGLGESWNDEVKAAWVTTYGILSDTMIKAGNV